MSELTPELAAEMQAQFAAVLKDTAKYLRRHPEHHLEMVYEAVGAGGAAALTAVGWEGEREDFEKKFAEALGQIAEMDNNSGHAVRVAEVWRIHRMAAEESKIMDEREQLREEFAAKGWKLTPDGNGDG